MRITEIDVSRFRVWRSLLLRLNPKGLNVIYGPNEAGKTTLMRFVRAMLYGFDPLQSEVNWRKSDDELPWKGGIRCRHRGKSLRIQRKAARKTRGSVRISGLDGEAPGEAFFSELLCDTSETLFNDVFAIGVAELQQLATLESDAVASQIYGLSLGPDGRRLLESTADIRHRTSALLSSDGQTGTLPILFENYRKLASAPPGDSRDRERHARMFRQQQDLEKKSERLRKRELSIQDELRGLRHLQHCHTPWKRMRDLEAELNDVPLVQQPPTDVFDQLNACDEDARKWNQRFVQFSEQAKQADIQAQRLQPDTAFEKDRYAIQSMVDQADWLRQIDQQVQTTEERNSELKRELDHAVADLGEGWTLQRVEQIDTTPEAHATLLQLARKYQAALSRRGKLRRYTRSLSKKSQQELVELENDLAPLGEQSIDEAVREEQERLSELESLGHLRLEADQLQQKSKTIREVVSRVDQDDSVPEWVDTAMGTIAVIGTMLCFSGLLLWAWALGGNSEQVLHGALAGAAFGFSGLMWWGIRVGLKAHFEKRTGVQLDDLHEEAQLASARLADVRQRIHGIEASAVRALNSDLMDADESPVALGTKADIVELIGRSTRRAADLERLARRQERAQARRDRLRTLRKRFRTAQQGVTEMRQQWCRHLTEIGLDETVKVKEAFEWWHRIQEVREVQSQWRNSAPEVEGLRRMIRGTAQRVEQLGRKLDPDAKHDYGRPLEVLSAWKQTLANQDRDRSERDRLRKEAELKRREAASSQHQQEAAELRKEAILARAGVASIEEIRQQIEWAQLREDLESQLSRTRDELMDVSTAEPTLAIVEDDLHKFNAPQATERIQLLELELTEVEESVGAVREKLGSLKQEVKALENDRGVQSSFFERAEVAAKIHDAAEEWFALRIEEQAVRRMRERFESGNVSETLTTASSIMERLTGGRYKRIWAPLGEDYLCIDDENRRTFRVEQLSGGTREQLFLAIRFALVRQFAKRGIELPMVMDDLFVNFDNARTQSAIDTLLEFAEDGQQILFFTCHQHLAEMFDHRGVSPLWLPGHTAAETTTHVFESVEAAESVETESEAGLPGYADADELFEEEDEEDSEPEPVADLATADLATAERRAG